MRINRFEDIDGWKKARTLTTGVYKSSDAKGFRHDYALRDQIRKASISIMANIAEGYGAYSDKEFIRYLHYAKASASEVQSHLYVALDLGYSDESSFNELYQLAEECKKLIGGFIRYLKTG